MLLISLFSFSHFSFNTSHGIQHRQQGDPIEERYKEFTDRGPAIDQLAYCVNSYRDAVVSNDSKFDHIDLEEKQKV